MAAERVVIHTPLHLSERLGHATVVDAKNQIVCEIPMLGDVGAGVAQMIIDALNAIYARPTSTGNGHL